MSKIITISREFGSGGHIVGQLLADKLAIPYYDNQLLTLAVEHGDLKGRNMIKFDEKKSNPFLFEGNYAGNVHAPKGQPMEDVLFKLQTDVIKDIGREGDAIIVGRCADKILRTAGHQVISIFIAAPMEQRVQRIMELYDVDAAKAQNLIRKNDKRRKVYYNHHTGGAWGLPGTYDYYYQEASLTLNEIADEVAAIFLKR